jgi:hypothetical protein
MISRKCTGISRCTIYVVPLAAIYLAFGSSISNLKLTLAVRTEPSVERICLFLKCYCGISVTRKLLRKKYEGKLPCGNLTKPWSIMAVF